MDGIILVHKPPGITSHDVVEKIRKILNEKKVGHYGTLDPMATGLIVIALRKATRLFQFFSKENKVYKGQIRLGYSTNTYDSSGTKTSVEINNFPSRDKILEEMRKFEGEILQVPPVFSAKKFRGKPLYVLARENKEVKLVPSKISIYFFHLKNYNPPIIDFEVKCSSGTYIRSLAHDLGQSLGCGAHISQLLRISSGNFNLKDSFQLEKIEELTMEGKTEEFILPLKILLPEIPKVIVNDTCLSLVKNGNMIFPENILKVSSLNLYSTESKREKKNIYKIFSSDGSLLAFAKMIDENNCFHPFIVIDP